MDSDKDATLLCGLKKKITPEEYAQMVENDTIVDAIDRYEVKEGDCFFLPAGRIHAIGTGCFLAEIQQTSDVTYRIYDFKRKDKDGNYINVPEDHDNHLIDAARYYILAVLLGKVMKPRKASKSDLGVY